MTIPRREPIQLRALVLIVRTWQLCQVPLIRDFDSRPGVVSTEASLENQEMKIEMARNFLLYFLDFPKIEPSLYTVVVAVYVKVSVSMKIIVCDCGLH